MTETNGLVGRDAFLLPARRRFREIAIEGFGAVRLRSLTERELAEIESHAVTSKGTLDPHRLKAARRMLIAASVVDADGNRILSDQDAEQLGDMDGQVADQIHDAARELCGASAIDAKKKS